MSVEPVDDEPKTITTSIAATMNASPTVLPASILSSEFDKKLTLDSDGHDLLNNPSLVDNYADILKAKPNHFSGGAFENSGSETDNENESASGSVVVTRVSANSSPSKLRSSILSNASSHYSVRVNRDDQAEEIDGTEEVWSKEQGNVDEEITMEIRKDDMDGSLDLTHDYDYSDSDFEDNMEKRLQDMSVDQRDDKEDDHDSGYERLGFAISDDDNEDDEEECEDNSDDIHALNPPTELDPEKLYALYAFTGPDPSHCQLKQDESCVLLNDQDSYWWLVKRSNDSKIGFAPAEILETFPERLARLNCWKNENMSSQGINSTVDDCAGLEDHEHDDNNSSGMSDTIDTLQNDESRKGTRSPVLKDYIKGNKSVSFNDVVSYADRFIEEELEDSDESDPMHYDEFTEVKLKIDKPAEDDDASEVVSDVSFNIASMVPLNIKKVRRPQLIIDENKPNTANVEKTIGQRKETSGKTAGHEVLEEDDDDLHKIFEAPVVPFSKHNARNGPHIENSNSDYSISTIGEFSPSSSEWTNESPQLQNDQFQGDSALIPSSRAIQDFSKYVDEDTIEVKETGDNGTISETPIDPTLSDTTEKDNRRSSQDNNHNSMSMASSSSSSEEIFMESKRIASSTSINTTSSVSRQPSNGNTHSSKHHPLIDELYNPIFSRMDELMKQIDEIVNK